MRRIRRWAVAVLAVALAIVAVYLPAVPPASAGTASSLSGSVCAVPKCPFEGATRSVQAASTSGGGYRLVASDGGIFAYGAPFLGSTGGTHLNKPIVGMAATPDGNGYYLVASDGGIFSFGDARFQGSTGGIHLNRPIVGMAVDPATGGYWLVASDGGIFAYGAPFLGSTGGTHLNKPIVGMAATPDGNGYYLVASDGGIFSFGDARFQGSTGGIHLNQPIVGMAVDPATGGYWLVASDGGIFAYGAPFLGSTGGTHLNKPIVGMAATPDGNGYYLVASDGGIFSFGDARFQGSTGGIHLNQPIVGMAVDAATPLASLRIDVADLPAGKAAAIQLRRPDGGAVLLTGPATFIPAETGTWTVTADPVDAPSDTYYPVVAVTTVAVTPGSQETVTVDYGQVVANTTRSIIGDAIISVTSPDADGRQTALIRDPSHTLAVGDVLAVGVTPATLEGLLLDITEVTANPDGTETVTGTQGSLTDLGPQADLIANSTFGVQADAVHDAAAVSPTSNGFINDIPCTAGSETVEGSVLFSPAVHFQVQWGGLLPPGTFTAQASAAGTLAANLDVNVAGSPSCAYSHDLLAQDLTLGHIPITFGPIDVVVVPKLNFGLEATAGIGGTLDTSVDQNLALTAGVGWNGNTTYPIASLSHTFSYTPPSPILTGTLSASIGPKVTFDIDDFAGPAIDANVGVSLAVQTAASPWWTLDGTFDADAGIALDIWKTHFAANLNVFELDWPFAQADTPAPLTISSVNLLPADQDSPYQDALTATGGAPPYMWAITTGTLPAGLSLDASTGIISGTPLQASAATFTVTVTDHSGATATRTYTLTPNQDTGGSTLGNVRSVTGDVSSYCAVLETGGVDCWGNNGDGQLGNGTTTDSATPVAVTGITDAASVNSDGGDSYCAVLTSGSVSCWGLNGNGELGNGTRVNSNTPVPVTGITNADSLTSGGGDSYCAVLTTGAVDCWGANPYGELGNGTTTDSSTPVAVTGITDAASLISNEYPGSYCAVLTIGTVDCWGNNGLGQLGDGTTTDSSTPVAVTGITNAIGLSTGGFESNCATLATGAVDCWGFDLYGQLGNGTTTNDSATPVAVTGITNAASVTSIGGDSYCAVLTTGGVDCWGANGNGQLGDGTTTNSSTPVPATGITDAASVTSDQYPGSYCVVLTTGAVDCWGANPYGELGNGTTADAHTPVAVTGINNALSLGEGAAESNCATLSTGSVDCWGNNSDGQLGDGTTTNSETPVPVSAVG